MVTIHLEAYFNDDLFDCRDTTFMLGDFDGCDFPEGVCRAILTFNEGSEYRCQVTKPLSFSPAECQRRGIPENAVLWYQISVKSCEIRERPNSSASSHENMDILLAMKSRANAYLKAGKYRLANYMYGSICFLAFEYCDTNDYLNIRRICCQNRTICLLNMLLPDECIDVCDYALEKDPNNEKCWYRKGLAYIMKNNVFEAEKCYEKVLELNPDNKEAKKKLDLCRNMLDKEATQAKDLLDCAIKQLGESAFCGDAD
ncbi:Peptidyl-prolyl cis-tran isomerase FKBP4 [Taenia crassiceps]|uniref:peptidylprolyl isomerase n=1 Tax=Taenia crassiceps TaxID=6207 RepID=A0ABR4QSZ6_9CEST